MTEAELIEWIRAICEPFGFIPSHGRVLRECDGGNIRRVIGAVNLLLKDEKATRSKHMKQRLHEWGNEVNKGEWKLLETLINDDIVYGEIVPQRRRK